MLFVLVITSLLVLFVWYCKIYHESYVSVEIFPGPPTWPLIGNALEFLGKSPSQLLPTLEKLKNEYGQTIRMLIGQRIQIILTDPKDVEIVLSSQKLLDKSDEYDFIRPWLAEGVFTAKGQKSLSRRKVLAPAFHFSNLEQFVDVFDKHSKILVEKLSSFKDRKVEVSRLLSLCTLDIFCGMRKTGLTIKFCKT